MQCWTNEQIVILRTAGFCQHFRTFLAGFISHFKYVFKVRSLPLLRSPPNNRPGIKLNPLSKPCDLPIPLKTVEKLRMTSSTKEDLFPSNFTSDSPPQSWVEPSPDWFEAIKEWKWLWEVHVYGFATIFASIAFFAFICLVASRKAIFTKQRAHMAVMNAALVSAGAFRSFILFWDPYASSGETSDAQLLLCIIVWGIASACITSSFSIMLLIFLETTKISLGPPRLKNLRFLASITIANILYLVVSDLVVWFYPETKVMIFICQFAFATWGLAISIGYSVAGVRMWRNLKSSLGQTFFSRIQDQDYRRLNRLFVLLCSASCFGVMKFSLSIYTAVGEYGVFADIGFVKNWPWFVVQSLLRALESLVCVFIFLIVFRNRKGINTAEHATPNTVAASGR